MFLKCSIQIRLVKTHFKLQSRGSSSEHTKDIQEGTILTNFRMRDVGAGATLSSGRSTSKCHYSFGELSFHPASQVQPGTESVLPVNLAYTPPW